MKTVPKEQFFYRFSAASSPVLRVASGETLVFEAQDALGGQIVDENSSASAIDWDAVNPATGPVYIEDAQPGDVLKVTIHSIEVASSGPVMAAENSGFYGDCIEGIHFKIGRIEGETAMVGGIRYPLNPMIGVIGVAPEGPGQNTGTPGSHGGNMDNKKIAAGSILYLPVFVPGALFGLGDLHAVMADGEVGVTGVEVAGKVTVTLEVCKGVRLSNPLLEDVGYLYFIGSAKTLDEAAKITLDDAKEMLMDRLGYSTADVAMFLTLCGNLEICQIVDPLVTVRLAVAKDQLQQAGFKLRG